jgi:hypothetical protein
MSPLRPVMAAGAVLAMLAMLALRATAASADGPPNAATCSGASLQSPGILPPGTYSSLTVQGVCLIPGGTVHVDGNVNVTPGSVFLANFPPLGPGGPEGDATVTVGRNILVGTGATLVLGCTPSNGCANTTHNTVGGNIVATQPLGMLVHGDAINGNVIHSGGGGGVNCNPVGFFAAIGSPAFSAYEDGSVGGNMVITGVQSCWLGIARQQVGGNVILQSNDLADPDAIEILSNTISHNLICNGNSMVWNSAEANPEGGLFPRVPEPNTVGHQRIGQCVLASPTTPGGPPGPGPF